MRIPALHFYRNCSRSLVDTGCSKTVFTRWITDSQFLDNDIKFNNIAIQIELSKLNNNHPQTLLTTKSTANFLFPMNS